MHPHNTTRSKAIVAAHMHLILCIAADCYIFNT